MVELRSVEHRLYMPGYGRRLSSPMRHKTREMLVSQRTQLLNGLRGRLTEVGVIAPQGALSN
jgi:hypothetical protein